MVLGEGGEVPSQLATCLGSASSCPEALGCWGRSPGVSSPLAQATAPGWPSPAKDGLCFSRCGAVVWPPQAPAPVPEAAAFPDQGSRGLLPAQLPTPRHSSPHKDFRAGVQSRMAGSCHSGSGRRPHGDLGQSRKSAFEEPQTTVQGPHVSHTVTETRVSLGQSEV